MDDWRLQVNPGMRGDDWSESGWTCDVKGIGPTSLSPSIDAIKVLLDEEGRVEVGGGFPGV